MMELPPLPPSRSSKGVGPCFALFKRPFSCCHESLEETTQELSVPVEHCSSTIETIAPAEISKDKPRLESRYQVSAEDIPDLQEDHSDSSFSEMVEVEKMAVQLNRIPDPASFLLRLAQLLLSLMFVKSTRKSGRVDLGEGEKERDATSEIETIPDLGL